MPAVPEAPTAFTCARIAVETAPGEYALRAERATLELQPLSLSVKAAATEAPLFHFPLRDVVLGLRAAASGGGRALEARRHPPAAALRSAH